LTYRTRKFVVSLKIGVLLSQTGLGQFCHDTSVIALSPFPLRLGPLPIFLLLVFPAAIFSVTSSVRDGICIHGCHFFCSLKYRCHFFRTTALCCPFFLLVHFLLRSFPVAQFSVAHFSVPFFLLPLFLTLIFVALFSYPLIFCSQILPLTNFPVAQSSIAIFSVALFTIAVFATNRRLGSHP